MSKTASQADPLDSLENRIRKAVNLVASLRSERDEARAQLVGIKKPAAAAEAEVKQLRQELKELRREHSQVRARIEKLLGQMDMLGES